MKSGRWQIYLIDSVDISFFKVRHTEKKDFSYDFFLFSFSVGRLIGDVSYRTLWSYIRTTDRSLRRPHYCYMRFAFVHSWSSLHVSSSQSIFYVFDVWSNFWVWWKLHLHRPLRDRAPLLCQISFLGHWTADNECRRVIGSDEPCVPGFADSIWLEGDFCRPGLHGIYRLLSRLVPGPQRGE